MISFVGVLLTGGLGLLKLGGFWFAVKDAAVSSVIGIAVLASVRAREPLVKTLFCNETVMDLPRVEGALRDRGTEAAYAKRGPHPVGTSTAALGDGRRVVVWYPADASAAKAP